MFKRDPLRPRFFFAKQLPAFPGGMANKKRPHILKPFLLLL